MRTTLAIVTFPPLCLLLSFFVLLSDPAFTYLLLDEDAHEPTRALLDYFSVSGAMPGVFDENEASHLADVKSVIIMGFVALFFLVFAHTRLTTFDNWRAITRWGTLLLACLLIISALIPFDVLFTWFHVVFFPQGNWMFPAQSTLIQYYPAPFFATYAFAIGIHSLLVAFVLLWLSSLPRH